MSIDVHIRREGKWTLGFGVDNDGTCTHWTRGTDFTKGRYLRAGLGWLWLDWYASA